MKRVLSVLLCVFILISLVACQGKQKSPEDEAPSPTPTTVTVDELLASVVALKCTFTTESGVELPPVNGSGVIVGLADRGMYVLTNYHVVYDCYADVASAVSKVITA